MKRYKTLQELFSDKKRWTKHVGARNKYGHEVDPNSKSAVKWCMLGAMEKVYAEKSPIIESTVRLRVGRTISVWNDYDASFDDIKRLCKELKI